MAAAAVVGGASGLVACLRPAALHDLALPAPRRRLQGPGLPCMLGPILSS